MIGIEKLFLFPFLVLIFALDVAIVGLILRLLARTFDGKALLFMDSIISPGVDALCKACSPHIKHHCKEPISGKQEEVLILLILALARWILAVIVI